MRQIIPLTIFITLFNLQSFTQGNSCRISGVVKDMNKQVEEATGALLRGSDSLHVKFTLTDQQGEYRDEGLPACSYQVTVSTVGCCNIIIPNINIGPQQLFEVQPVIKEFKAKDLVAGTEVAGRPITENKNDRTIKIEAIMTNVSLTTHP